MKIQQYIQNAVLAINALKGNEKGATIASVRAYWVSYVSSEEPALALAKSLRTKAQLIAALEDIIAWLNTFNRVRDIEAAHVEALEMNSQIDAINDPRTDDEGNDPREWCGNDIQAAHAEALEMNYRIDCTAHLHCRHMDAVNQEYIAMRNEADAMNTSFDTSFHRAAKNWGAMDWFSRERELAKAHTEALTINTSRSSLVKNIIMAAMVAVALCSSVVAPKAMAAEKNHYERVGGAHCTSMGGNEIRPELNSVDVSIIKDTNGSVLYAQFTSTDNPNYLERYLITAPTHVEAIEKEAGVMMSVSFRKDTMDGSTITNLTLSDPNVKDSVSGLGFISMSASGGKPVMKASIFECELTK